MGTLRDAGGSISFRASDWEAPFCHSPSETTNEVKGNAARAATGGAARDAFCAVSLPAAARPAARTDLSTANNRKIDVRPDIPVLRDEFVRAPDPTVLLLAQRVCMPPKRRGRSTARAVSASANRAAGAVRELANATSETGLSPTRMALPARYMVGVKRPSNPRQDPALPCHSVPDVLSS